MDPSRSIIIFSSLDQADSTANNNNNNYKDSLAKGPPLSHQPVKPITEKANEHRMPTMMESIKKWLVHSIQKLRPKYTRSKINAFEYPACISLKQMVQPRVSQTLQHPDLVFIVMIH